MRGRVKGEAIFRWETLREIGPHGLGYPKTVPGKIFEVELTTGRRVRVWRADDARSYFCHGLTFSGKDAPGGPISPFSGKSVEAILEGYCQPTAESTARAGDLAVWRAPPPESTPHSAILVGALREGNRTRLDYAATFRTKNGLSPETVMTLKQLIREYGETYAIYRRR